MARVDLNHENGWIPEQEGPVLEAVRATSAVEATGRRFNMTSDLANFKSLSGANARIVAEGALIPDASLEFNEVALRAFKWAEILPLSYEDVSDSSGSVIEAYKQDFFTNFALKYDNAALGVTAAQGTTTGTLADRPFNSAYYVASQNGRVIQTAGDVTLEDVSAALGALETTPIFNASRAVIIAHPQFKAALRLLKDEDGNPVYSAGQAVSGGVGETLFGIELRFSFGARTSATMTDAPTGNPLLIVADRSALIVGVRSGPESILSTEVDFKTDVYNLKMRARRGFLVSEADNVSIVEKTASA